MNDKKRKLVEARPVDPRRHYQIAMVLASLVGGLLTLFNLDRTVNVHHAKEVGHLASLHGWPTVYLQRTFAEETPIYVRQLRQWDWPFPVIEGELRTWNIANLCSNILVGLIIMTIVYWFVRTAVFRFDQWRRNASTKPAPRS